MARTNYILLLLSAVLLSVPSLYAQNECASAPGQVNLSSLNAVDSNGVVHQNVCWNAVSKALTFPLFSGGSGLPAGCSGAAGVITCAGFNTTSSNGGVFGTEGTCANLTPAAGSDLLCPSSTGGPLGIHGWIVNNNNAGWQPLNYPDITDSVGVSITFGVPTIFPQGASGSGNLSLSFASRPNNGFFSSGLNGMCAVMGDTCDYQFSGGLLRIISGSGFGWSSSNSDARTAADTALGRFIANWAEVSTTDSIPNQNGGLVNLLGFGTKLVVTSTLAVGVPVKADTANANQVVTTTTADTGSGIVIGVTGTAATAANASAIIIAGGVVPMTLGTGTCSIGNFVIVDTTTNSRVKCTGTYAAGTVIGTALAAQATVGNTFNVLVNVK